MSRTLMTTKEAAQYLYMQPHTLECWRWQKDGNGLRYYKQGRRVRYDKKDLDIWLSQHLEPRISTLVGD